LYSGENIKERLESLIEKYYPQIDMRVVFKTPFELGMLFPFKDHIAMELRALVVYTIGCCNCDSFYIGKTKRCLKIRIEEHKKGVKSSVFAHEKDKGHKLDWENDGVTSKRRNK
jgi:hypothetical protein